MTILSKFNSSFAYLLAATLLTPVPVALAGPNQAPTANVLTPANGTKYSAPASIGLTASAADADGSVARVEYYLGRTLLGSATTPPYLFNWTNVPAGSYVLNATAIDNQGKAGDSANITITVAAVTTFITSPLANA